MRQTFDFFCFRQVFLHQDLPSVESGIVNPEYMAFQRTTCQVVVCQDSAAAYAWKKVVMPALFTLNLIGAAGQALMKYARMHKPGCSSSRTNWCMCNCFFKSNCPHHLELGNETSTMPWGTGRGKVPKAICRMRHVDGISRAVIANRIPAHPRTWTHLELMHRIFYLPSHREKYVVLPIVVVLNATSN